jgi:transposase
VRQCVIELARAVSGSASRERTSPQCPQILGIDQHLFTRRRGYATTFCDLKNHTVYDVVLGRRELSLEGYLSQLEGKHLVKVVCIDLAAVCRALVRKHFPNSRIVRIGFTSSGWSIITSRTAGRSRSGWIEESRTDFSGQLPPLTA